MAKIQREKMPVSQRAKQFAPFAALKGFEEAIKKKEKIFLPKIDFSDEMAQKLDEDLKMIQNGQKITVTYFYDGEYFDISGTVKKLDTFCKTLTLDESTLLIEDIINIIFL